MYINKDGSWTKIKSIYVNLNGAWQKISRGFVNISSAWKVFFSGENVPQIESQVTISQSTNSSNGLVTLTGRNFHWTDALSLTYYFEWSSDGGSVWNELSTGSINNPSSGTFNEVTHIVQVNQTSPAIDNLYRFRVYAVNITLNNSSTSTSTTISTPRNIVWAVTPITSIQYNSATLNFSGGLYSNSYRVRIVNTSDNTTSYQTISGSPGTITGLTQSKNYTVYITGYTGSSANGYPGNESAGQSFSTPAAPAPIQVTAPTAPTGNASPFNQVTIGASGSYPNIGNDPGVLTKSLVKIAAGTTITNGSTTALGTVVTSPYTVTQVDATIPKVNFYTRDNVIGLDNQTYYYYSPVLTSFIGQITDNFNRTTANGLGTSSSGYIYNGPDVNAVTWSTNGSVAISSQSVPSGTTNSANFAMDSFETNDANVSVSMAAHGAVPSGSLAGYGASVWVTSSNNWWAVISTYDATAFTETRCTTYTCYNNGCCPGGLCSSCTYLNKNDCISGAGFHQTTTSTTPNCTGFTDSCGGCTLSGTETRYGYTKRSTSTTTTYTYQPWVSQATRTYGIWTTTTTFTWPTVIISGSGSFRFYACSTTNNASGSVCPSTMATTPYDASDFGLRCGPCTSVTSTVCGAAETYNTDICPPYIPSPSVGDRCTPDCTVGSTIICGSSVTGSSCPGYSATPSIGSRCSSADCTSTTTTTYPCNTTVNYDTSCPPLGNNNGDRCSACTDQIIYNWTFPKYLEKYQYGLNVSYSGYNYNSRLQLVSSANGSVSYPTWDGNGNGIVKTNKVDGSLDNNNYTRIAGLVVSTNNNTITASASTPTETFTDLVKTTSGVTKTEADGSSSAGIIKGHTQALSSEGRIDSITIN